MGIHCAGGGTAWFPRVRGRSWAFPQYFSGLDCPAIKRGRVAVRVTGALDECKSAGQYTHMWVYCVGLHACLYLKRRQHKLCPDHGP